VKGAQDFLRRNFSGSTPEKLGSAANTGSLSFVARRVSEKSCALGWSAIEKGSPRGLPRVQNYPSLFLSV
jgi:hypothetical protein